MPLGEPDYSRPGAAPCNQSLSGALKLTKSARQTQTENIVAGQTLKNWRRSGKLYAAQGRWLYQGGQLAKSCFGGKAC